MSQIIIFSIFLNLIRKKKKNFRSLKYQVFDIPDFKRKIHKKTIPLLGGLLIFINFFFFFIVNYLNSKIFFFQGSNIGFEIFIFSIIMFFILGYYDDKNDLNSSKKFISMILILSFSLFCDNELIIKKLSFSFLENEINLNNFSSLVTILCFLLFINAFNMIDGINCQSSTYALLILIIFLTKNILILFCIVILIPLVFFIYYNYKDKIYLGDSGTLILGFLISYMFIKSYNLNFIQYVDEIFLIMCIPGYELLRLFIKRIIKKKNPFSADKNHLHHYLIDKYTWLETFIFFQVILFLPFLTYIFSKSFILSFTVSLLIYYFGVNFLPKLKKSKNI